MQHPPLQSELWCAIPALNYVFFFYSVTDVISNVAKYNTSVKIYLSKSKITDLKNYLKITKYTKKLLNYSNVSKSNSLLYTSASEDCKLLARAIALLIDQQECCASIFRLFIVTKLLKKL